MTTPHPAELTEGERVRLRYRYSATPAKEVRALLDALEAAERERGDGVAHA